MANAEAFATLFQSTLATQALNTATSINLTTTSGLPASPKQFRLRFEPAGGSTSTFELALCQVVDSTHVQSVDATTGSVSVNGRGIEGTSAQTWAAGSLATQVVTATGLTNIGPSGTFVTLAVAGLTGAVAASRYAGATASGAPASGTFAVGDFVIDQLGCIHVCTAAGTPGTWSSPPMGTLGYAQTTSDSGLVTTETTVITAPSVTVGSGRRIRVSAAYSYFVGSVMGDTFDLRLKEGGTQLNAMGIYISTSGNNTGAYVSTILAPSAAAHTYVATLARTSGTGNINGKAGSNQPAYILVEDLGV